MSSYDDRLKEVMERTATAMHAFWSAMLTAHTVFLSVAVALASISKYSEKWQIQAVGALATLSMLALLLNFAAWRMQYDAIVRRLRDYEEELTQAQLTADISKAVCRSRVIRGIETTTAALLFVEAGMFASVLFP